MIIRKCQICDKEFEIKNRGSDKKNCEDHVGCIKNKYKLLENKLHKECSKCNLYKLENEFYKRTDLKKINKSRRGHSWCKDCFNLGTYTYFKDRALKRKLFFINQKGGKCKICGYNKNIAALCFHHRHGKDFTLDSRKLASTSIKKLQKEIDKCDLLCHNCHMEEHYPHFELTKFYPIEIMAR